MAERELFLKIETIRDHSCGNYTIGEIDTMPDRAIKEYLDRFDEFGYTELTNWLIRAMAVTHNNMIKKRMEKEAAWSAMLKCESKQDSN